MPNHRKNRLNGQLTRDLSDIIREIKDPRINENLVTVTGVEVTPDLKFAKVFYSSLSKDDDKEISAGLASANGHIRSRLARTANLRATPELIFVRDDSSHTGARISEILGGLGPNSLDVTDEAEEVEETVETEE